jgi:cytochrome c oxidase subunit 2
MQANVLMISLVLMAIVTLVFWQAVRASQPASKDAGAPGAEKIRKGMFWALVVLGVVVMTMTLREWPHDASAPADALTITATGTQWSWEMSTQEIPAGKPVVFAVTSSDVNHGFGLYDESGAILFQTQAMPGYVNKVRYTFDKPGVYRVLCMEYCGLSHHEMIGELHVVQ